MKPPPGLAHLLLGQPDIAELVMRALALKGQLPSYLGQEFEPNVLVSDLTTPEFLWLRRVVRLSQGVNLAATAAQFSQIALVATANAARSMCFVESLIIANATAAAQAYLLDFQPNAVLGAAPNVPKSALDDRAIPFNQLQPTPSFGIFNATNAVAITGIGAIVLSVPAGQTLQVPLNAVLTARTVLGTPAQSAIMLQGSAVNLPLQAAFLWRERALLASEAQ